ncbi:MAG: hypothetical protein V1789_09395 [PVC group bacterium]
MAVRQAVISHAFNEPVRVTILRKGEEQTVTVRTGRLPSLEEEASIPRPWR